MLSSRKNLFVVSPQSKNGFKNLDTYVDTDIVCGDDKNSGSAKNEFDILTMEDSLPVFDLVEMTKVSQVACKSFSD
ncbi:hypothetical protein AFK62_14085 [Cronobacter condimenti 1330]|uniref:Uncharacterized protein n=1 Tax=Cronobacter condimenti 1330 TaxID=1073999 RepID=A0ABN4IAK9_9ENTR|nr:hypothetical protein AFK62_14085 [Cronobacter condimenti 1330]